MREIKKEEKEKKREGEREQANQKDEKLRSERALIRE